MVRKKVVAMEPSKNLDLDPHSRSSTSGPRRKRRKPRYHSAPHTAASSDSDPPPPSSPCSVPLLIEPYPKPRLVSILAEAAAANPALRARLRAAADASPSHRRLFVHGLAPSADNAVLADAFSRFGALGDCNAVADRASGRCKGYGFVTFASRAAARLALRHAPSVSVAGRPVSAQFATAGPMDSPGSGGGGAGAGRRVYVTNVAPDAGVDRLRAFFARFGDLEGGPFGFDAESGRSRGYALFVYRAARGAAKAVEEPLRMFEGCVLHCQLANEPVRRSKAPASAAAGSASLTPPPAAVEAPALQPVLDAVVAAGVGDLAACARNLAQAAALLGQNPVLAAAALSSALASAAAARRPAASSSIPPSPAVTSASMPGAELRRATAAAAVPSSVKVGFRPNGGEGLLGPYKPPSSTSVSSSSGKNGTILGT